ncbi:hypothetical protein ACLOJK_021074 [Asimina triloba]
MWLALDIGHGVLGLCDEFPDSFGAFVGINVGTSITNPPSAKDVVKILKEQQITHVRLFDSDHQMLSALADTGIEVMVSVSNDEILGIGESRSAAANWINQNVAAYLPATNITSIAVGNEVLTVIPNAAPILVPAMQFLQSALVATNLNGLVKVSSPQAMKIIPKHFPPSAATFNSTWNNVMDQFVQFLKDSGSFFMLNAHPYNDYTRSNGIFPIEYALFKPLSLNERIADPNTLLHYNSMLESMVDAAYFSMEARNFSGIPVLVTETGWPWLGGANESDATESNAEVYNSNLVLRVQSGLGTPHRPDMPVSAYIYELYNEDLRPGSISEKNWGVFFPNGTAVYPVDFSGVGKLDANATEIGVFCVARPNASSDALLDGLNWACGPGLANCSAIQPGQPCYDPDTIANHASYAYNDYYHRTTSTGRTCNFNGTAMLSSTDPSYGSCIYAGSSGSNSSSGSTSPPPFSPDIPSRATQIPVRSYVQSMGSEGNANGCRYDLTKSRRTRKPMLASGYPPDHDAIEEGVQSKEGEVKEGTVDRQTLKSLMDGDNETKRAGGGDVGHRKKSLGHHFLEEEHHHLALVTKQGDRMEGTNASGMVGHYIKVLNHLIKAKRGHRKRVIGRLLT